MQIDSPCRQKSPLHIFQNKKTNNYTIILPYSLPRHIPSCYHSALPLPARLAPACPSLQQGHSQHEWSLQQEPSSPTCGWRFHSRRGSLCSLPSCSLQSHAAEGQDLQLWKKFTDLSSMSRKNKELLIILYWIFFTIPQVSLNRFPCQPITLLLFNQAHQMISQFLE